MPTEGSPGPTAGTFMTIGKPGSCHGGGVARNTYPAPPAFSRSPRVKPSMTVPCKPRTPAVSTSDATAHPERERGRQSRALDLRRDREMIVGHALEGDPMVREIEQRIGGARVAVARLTHRTGNREPAAVRGHGNHRARARLEGDRAPRRALEVQARIVHVAAEEPRALRGPDRATGRGRAVDVVPPVGMVRGSVREAGVLVADRERKRGQVLTLRGRELLAGPRDRRSRGVV